MTAILLMTVVIAASGLAFSLDKQKLLKRAVTLSEILTGF
jgi:hypothetical protein